MLNLVAASACFLLIHFGVSGTRLRDTLVLRLGEGPYRGAFALASVIGLVWMIYAYRRAPTVGLWAPLPRSEEHTSELQSRFDLVCRLLLEKKKQEVSSSEVEHIKLLPMRKKNS